MKMKINRLVSLLLVLSFVFSLAVSAKDYSYDSLLYELNLSQCDDASDTGLINLSGIWNIDIGSEGTECLVGSFDPSGSNNKDSFIIDSGEWNDYTVEMSFKIIDNKGDDDRSTDDTLGVTVFTRTDNSLTSGNYFKYMFRNPPYYNNYFGGYAKDGGSALGILDNWISGKDDKKAQFKTNKMQTVKAKVYNGTLNNGGSVYHEVTLNGGTSEEFTTTKSKWHGAGSGLFQGRPGIEFLSSNKLAKYEVYSLKVTGERSNKINFTAADNKTPITQLTPSTDTVALGNVGINQAADLWEPAVIMAMYRGNTLIDINVVSAENLKSYGGDIRAFLRTPDDIEEVYIKAYIWNGLLSAMTPIHDGASIGEVYQPTAASAQGMHIDEQGVIKISGKVPNFTAGNPAVNVSIIVLNPQKEIADLETTDMQALKNTMSYIGQTETDSEGNYIFECHIQSDSNDLTGEYTALLKFDSGDIITFKDSYYDVEALRKTISEINSYSTEDINGFIDFINENSNILKINTALLQDINNKNVPYQAILNSRPYPTDISPLNNQKMIDTFENAVIVQSYNEADGEKMLNLLNNNKEKLNLENIKRYDAFINDLYAKEKLEVATALAQKDDISELSEIASDLDEAVAMHLLTKRIYSWQGKENAIKENNDLFGIVFTDYETLSNKNKEALITDFNQLTLLKASDVKQKFDALVKKYKDKSTASTGGGGSSGGGTSSGNSVVFDSATVNQQNPVIETLVSKKFSDLQGFSWAKDSIEGLADKGVLEGFEGKVRPGDSVLREEFVKMLVTAFNLLDDKATCKFDDVKEGEWYYPYIATASKLGLVNGIDEDNFGIGEEITRQEMAAIVHRFAVYAEGEFTETTPLATFTDESAIADYAKGSVEALQKSGIISGVGDGRFAPESNSTRAEAAVIIFRSLALAEKNGGGNVEK